MRWLSLPLWVWRNCRTACPRGRASTLGCRDPSQKANPAAIGLAQCRMSLTLLGAGRARHLVPLKSAMAGVRPMLAVCHSKLVARRSAPIGSERANKLAVGHAMWIDELAGKSWASLWSGYVVCGGTCPGIRKITGACPACGAAPFDTSPSVVVIDGREMLIHPTFAGAEGRYEDYIYLQMLEREWVRPVVEFERFSHFLNAETPSARAALVLLFWGYFETRIERLLRSAMRALPQRVLDDALKRYSGIGSRLYDLYKIFFGTNYFDDLRAQGFSAVADLLKDIHERRNNFSHGQPQAINDDIVDALVENLKIEHEAWIAVYNSRVRS